MENMALQTCKVLTQQHFQAKYSYIIITDLFTWNFVCYSSWIYVSPPCLYVIIIIYMCMQAGIVMCVQN